MTVTVIIPTHKRPEELSRCLDALRKQTRPADEILIIVRDNDKETETFSSKLAQDTLKIKKINVKTPGQVAALNVGLDEARGDIIAFTDDDAVPRQDWLERIEKHFLAESNAGGVGGRDLVYISGQLVKGERRGVGKITWYGRISGNHHLGTGGPREVDHLKGANMCFLKKALSGIRFDEQLRGSGAQYRNDLALCLAVKQAGWKLIYDPSIAADHYYSKRFDEDQRGKFDPIAIRDLAHNDIYIFLKYLTGLKRFMYIMYALLIGTIATPGIIQFFRLLPKKRKEAFFRFFCSMRGQWEGYKTWRKNIK
ncbi:MAG: glycosyltransferase [Candidatus Omnitrophota bacterium]|nr:MAG: glycosyltransferase [Candidatus Omnitrophota bacterium]